QLAVPLPERGADGVDDDGVGHHCLQRCSTRPIGQVWCRAGLGVKPAPGGSVVLLDSPTVPDLLIIRHGESEWNVEKRWQGWLDAPLTAQGRRQASARAHALLRTGFAPTVVHCSDLGRAQHTAEIVARVLGVAIRPDRGLRERSGGDWEGFTADEIDER